MLSLLRADFFRMWKSKSTLIGLIVCAVFPLVINLLYLGIAFFIAAFYKDEGIDPQMFGMVINARSIIGTIFASGSNVGLIIPMFAAIFICTDMTSGMLRNKIISGKPRKHIFFSYLICSAAINLMYILLYASLMVGFSLLFFNYSSGDIDASTEVVNILYYIISGIVAFLFLSTVALFFSLATGNSALSIVFTILFSYVLGTVNALLPLIPGDDAIYFVSLVPCYTASLNSDGVKSTVSFVEGLVSMIGFGAVNACLAYNIFIRKELK